MAHKAFNRDKFVRQLDTEQVAKLRKKVAGLRKSATAARRARKRRLREQKKRCSERRKRAVEAADGTFKKALAADREVSKARTVKRNVERKARQVEAREHCELERADIDADAAAAIALADKATSAERAWLHELTAMNRSVRGVDRRRRRGGARSSAARRKEKQQESDDAVRQELEPHEIAIFNRVKAHIKGSSRISRAEAFKQWLTENPAEQYEHEHDRPPNDDAYAAAEAAWLSERPFRKSRASAPLRDEVPF